MRERPRIPLTVYTEMNIAVATKMMVALADVSR
jgi:hypothetical protein